MKGSESNISEFWLEGEVIRKLLAARVVGSFCNCTLHWAARFLMINGNWYNVSVSGAIERGGGCARWRAYAWSKTSEASQCWSCGSTIARFPSRSWECRVLCEIYQYVNIGNFSIVCQSTIFLENNRVPTAWSVFTSPASSPFSPFTSPHYCSCHLAHFFLPPVVPLHTFKQYFLLGVFPDSIFRLSLPLA